MINSARGIHLGSYAGDPVCRPDLTPCEEGDSYLTAHGTFRVFSGGAWAALPADMLALADRSDPSRGASLIGHRGSTVADRLDAISLPGYDALRAYAGPSRHVLVVGNKVSGSAGISGLFMRDDSDRRSTDNAGTTIVGVSGTRWKRSFTGPLDVRWFGAKADGVNDDTAAIQLALDEAFRMRGLAVVEACPNCIVTSSLILGHHVVLQGGSITCTGRNLPIVKISKEHLNSFWQVRDISLAYSSLQPANAGSNAIQLGDVDTIAYDFVIANVSVSNASSAVSLPPLRAAYAFMGRFQNIRSYSGSGCAFEILGASHGAHTTLSFSECYYQGNAHSRAADSRLFNLRNINGLEISNCACDRAGTSSPLARLLSCTGRISSIVVEGNHIRSVNGHGAVFEFINSRLDISSLMAIDNRITITDSSRASFLRIASESKVLCQFVWDLNTVVETPDNDRYHTVAIDVMSMFSNEHFNRAGSSPPVSTDEQLSRAYKSVRRLGGKTRIAGEGDNVTYSSPSIPVNGNWSAGDRLRKSRASPASPVAEYVCVESGAAGTWRAVSSISARGPSSNRPKLGRSEPGVLYFDTDLGSAGKPIWWTGASWVDALGHTV